MGGMLWIAMAQVYLADQGTDLRTMQDLATGLRAAVALYGTVKLLKPANR